MEELHPPMKCVVRKVQGKGWGVIAKSKIKKDELIEDCYLVHLYDREEENIFYEKLLIHYKFNYPNQGSDWKIQALPLGFGPIYNHSDNPNATWKDHPYLDMVFQFIALRDIEVGEEICTSYGGENYWKNPMRKKVTLV